MEVVIQQQQRSLAETPTYSVASVVTVLVFLCFLVERSIYRFGKWLLKTRRKALFSALEKIKEELMLLGLISLLLAQCGRWISNICVDSSLFSSRFYICSEKEYELHDHVHFESPFTSLNGTDIPSRGTNSHVSHQCGEGREPFVSYQGLEQLHRFLFVLGITHVLYSCIAVGLSMSKIYSWRKWEYQATLQAKRDKVMRRQSTFVFRHTSHPWSRNRVLIWMLCFLRQFKSSIRKSDYLALRLGFFNKHRLPQTYDFHKYMVRSMEDEFNGILGISWPLWGYAIVCIFVNVHGLNMYFWLSFIPAILVMVVGTKLQHVVSSLALEVVKQTEPSTTGTQLKPRDDLFWFGKPEILLRLIQFIIFQNAFEMATFIWAMWGLERRSCFMENNLMIITRLACGVLVQFWCSYSTVPLNIIIIQMGSRFKKALVPENVRELLHNWCKRVKEKSKRDSLHSHTMRSVCSLESTIYDGDEMAVASGTLSRSTSFESQNQSTVTSRTTIDPNAVLEIPDDAYDKYLYLSESVDTSTLEQSPANGEEEESSNSEEDKKVKTLSELFQST